MRLTHLAVENLLSFDHFELDFDRPTTVVVGPNGSGKTNLLRAIGLVGDALGWAAEAEAMEQPGWPAPVGGAGQRLAALAGARHRGDPESTVSVRLGIKLDTDREHGLVVAFVRAVLALGLDHELSQKGVPASTTAWVEEEVGEHALAGMFEAELVIRHPEIPNAKWEVGLELDVGSDAPRCRWVLAGSGRRNNIVTLDEDGRPVAGAQVVEPGLAGSLGLLQPDPVYDQPSSLVDTWPTFRLASLVQSGVSPRMVLGGAGGPVVGHRIGPVRSFLAKMGAGHTGTGLASGTTEYSLATVLSRCWRESVVTLDESLRGIGEWGSQVPAAGRYRWEQFAAALPSAEPYLAPARLARLKNGTVTERDRYRAVAELFPDLTGGRSFEIRLTPVPVPASAGASESGDGASLDHAMIIDILVKGSSDDSGGDLAPELPIQLCGAGIWEALLLAEALAGSKGRMLLLDEPAANLHPTWQRALRAHLAGQGCQVLVITHTADLVPLDAPQDELAIVRLGREAGATMAWRLDQSSIPKLAAKLAAKGNEHVLFAEGAVICEGQDDIAVVRILAERSGIQLDDHSITMLDCGGRENIPAHVRLCQQLGIPYVAIMDGDQTKAAAKTEVAQQVQAVHDAVHEGGGTLVELEEDIEHVFGLEKKDSNSKILCKEAQTVDLGAPQAPAKLNELVTALHGLVTGEAGQPPARDSGGITCA